MITKGILTLQINTELPLPEIVSALRETATIIKSQGFTFWGLPQTRAILSGPLRNEIGQWSHAPKPEPQPVNADAEKAYHVYHGHKHGHDCFVVKSNHWPSEDEVIKALKGVLRYDPDDENEYIDISELDIENARRVTPYSKAGVAWETGAAPDRYNLLVLAGLAEEETWINAGWGDLAPRISRAIDRAYDKAARDTHQN